MGRKNYKFIAYIIIPLLLYAVFIVGGFFIVILESLNRGITFDWNELNIDIYRDLFQSKSTYSAIGFSLYIAFMSATFSTIIGVYIAQYIAFSHKKVISAIMEKLSYTFVILPYLYVVFLVLFMISDTGFLYRIFGGGEFLPSLLYDDFGIGIIFAYTLKGFPFVTLFTLNILTKVREEYFLIGHVLGASRRTVIKTIYIPICKNSIVWSSAVLFAYSLGSYEIPALLTNVRQITLPQLIYRNYTSPNIENFPKAMALNVILLLVCAIFGLLYSFIVAKAVDKRVL